MADETENGGESASPGARPVGGATSVPRERPVIEGRAAEIRLEETHSAAKEPDWDALPAPPTAEVTPESLPDPTPGPMPDSGAPADGLTLRRNVLWLLVAAIFVAAPLAVAGALGLHLLDRRPDVASLQARVTALEQRQSAAKAPSQNAAAQAALEERVAALETASGDTKSALAGVRADLDKLKAEKPIASPDLGPLEGRVAAVEQKLGALDAKLGALGETLAAEKGQVRATETRVSQSAAASADNEAVAILAANLLRKVEAGTPYAADLAALTNRGLDKSKIAPLEAAADMGIATPSALAKQFVDFTPAILATAPRPKEKGFLDHLMKGAERLVRVEKVGDTSADDLEGQVARIQAALEAGEIDTAYQDWLALADAAKAKSAEFGTAAKARIDAIAAARSLDAEAVAALGKTKS